ncbi:MAG: glycosyl hydrolase [Kiritimatiellae bacterium]|nr:glycosyl hydrolase [Kiritimatiellia bacterium]MDD5519770.1 glycosyl hydrolase [Kiritimatiellia bacterium]
MKKILSVFTILIASVFVPFTSYCQEQTGDSVWPAITKECKPWAYWWWLGSAVDEVNLSKELARYQEAGMGGVHIIPIYGAKGYEDRYIEYLSPKWMQMLHHTVTEARRLGLDIDMTTGTGWCFGGPNISTNDACAGVVVKTNTVTTSGRLTEKFDPKSIQALVAFSDEGKMLELTNRIKEDGTVDWTAENGPWKIYSISQRLSMKVKRAAPGGEGYMLNPFYLSAIRNYLKRFSDAFDKSEGPRPRAMYHDSFEYYGANWSPDFLRQFEKRRGYKLQPELPVLFGPGDNDRTARVKSDYRETISDMLCENFIPVWTKWSHKYGFITRNQAHGSTGNILDLYAAADLPETEMFHTDRRPLISKFASSAAHVAGHKLVSAETGTWLKEHFTETLADLKSLMDDMFVSGINHVFYHGTCYSPDEAGWPGWLFYASTEMNPRNSFWRDVPALNAYIARCQSVLQSGQPDNDILMYWPIYDYWHDTKGLQLNISIHGGEWFLKQSIGPAASNLWNRGFTFDYCSDSQLANSKTINKLVKTTGGTYQAVVVPTCDHMPVTTLENLLTLAKRGGTIIFQDHLPADVPGFADLEKRRTAMKKLISVIKLTDNGKIKEAKYGKGKILVGELEPALTALGIKREPIVDHPGIIFIRRSFESGYHYFISNSGQQPLNGWITLARKAESVILMDALKNKTGKGAIKKDVDGRTQVYLQLQSGESVILRTFTDKKVDEPAWQYCRQTGDPCEITGQWHVKFIQGGPSLPKPLETVKLGSWTTLGDDDSKRFAGTGLYSIKFDVPPQSADKWTLNLGKVCESARVRLNGKDLGTLIMSPFRVVIDQLKPKENELEVEVTNLSANRIRDLDTKGIKWRNFNDINFVSITYKPFDASKWPILDSGLLGPVTITPVSILQP